MQKPQPMGSMGCGSTRAHPAWIVAQITKASRNRVYHGIPRYTTVYYGLVVDIKCPPFVCCFQDQEDSRGRLAQDSRSFSKDESQLMPRSSTSASKSIHRGNSQSSALEEGTEPQEEVKSMKSFHRGSSLNSAFLAEVAESQEDGKSSRGENTPKDAWHFLDSSNLGSPKV